MVFLKLDFILDTVRPVRPFDNLNEIKTFRIKSPIIQMAIWKINQKFI